MVSARKASIVLQHPRSSRAEAHGYARLLGLGSFDGERLQRRVLDGFAYAALLRLQEKFELSTEQIGHLVQIKPRTLARRKSEGRLLAEESDRLLRAARILGLTLDLFEGDAVATRRWMLAKNRGLGERAPLEVARTDVGAREVEALIGRLEHGVVS